MKFPYPHPRIIKGGESSLIAHMEQFAVEEYQERVRFYESGCGKNVYTICNMYYALRVHPCKAHNTQKK